MLFWLLCEKQSGQLGDDDSGGQGGLHHRALCWGGGIVRT